MTARLERGVAQGLVLVGAGPGYGKTALLRDWAQRTARPAYWYTLQPEDRTAGRFLDHLLETVRAAGGPPTGGLPDHAAPSSPAAAMAALAAELAGWGTEVALVLDDYQAVAAGRELPEGLDWLLRTPPHNLRLVIAGRALPALAPDHLLTWGGATVLGPRDLAFTAIEAGAFFAQHGAPQVDAAAAYDLWAASAGWITGMLLRARIHPELRAGALVPAFSPTEPLAQYLQAEVWEPCPPAWREFLLGVCHLPVIPAAGGDALWPQRDVLVGLGQALERGVLLEVGADGQYRFNPLFRQFLRTQLPGNAAQLARPPAEESHMRPGPGASGPPLARAPLAGEPTPLPAAPAAGGQEASREPSRPGYGAVAARGGPAAGSGDTAIVQVEALGPGRVRRGGEEIPLHDWGYRQARELFFFLFFHGPASKAQVGECFWPGRRKRALSRVFHVALHYVRQALGDGELLVYRDGRYSWNPAAPVWCDAQEFAALLDRADLLPAGDPRAVPLLQEALRLYHGDFLAEFAGPCWTAYREELAGRQVRALLRLGNLHLDAGRSVAARRCFLQVLERDTLREEACQGLLLSYRQSGDETAARRAYEQFRRRLWQERRREPWPATAALVGPKPS